MSDKPKTVKKALELGYLILDAKYKNKVLWEVTMTKDGYNIKLLCDGYKFSCKYDTQYHLWVKHQHKYK